MSNIPVSRAGVAAPRGVSIMRRSVRRSLAGIVSAAMVMVGIGVAAPPAAQAAACATTPLALTWDSSKTTGLLVDLPIRSAPVTVNWGDGTPDSVVSAVPGAPTSHTYAAAGIRTIEVCGPLARFGSFIRTWTKLGASGFTAVTSFPETLTDLGGGFSGWTNLTDVPNYLPSGVTTLASAFNGATKFNDPDIASWNTTNVTTLASTFVSAAAFNQPIGSWNTAKVTTLSQTFFGATVFNQPLASWNTSLVTTMSETFRLAKAFNQNLTTWDTSKVTTMATMFNDAWVFNNGSAPGLSDAPLTWNTGLVTTLEATFWAAKAFNQPVGSWNTSRNTSLYGTFNTAEKFNQNLGTWDTTNVTAMNGLFKGALVFNNAGSDSIKNWNTAKNTTLTGLLWDAPKFNQPIGSWNVSAVTQMSFIFKNAAAFDQDLGNWSPTALTAATEAYAPTNMYMSIANYDKLLLGWSSKVLKSAVPFDWGLHRYSCAAEPARIKMSTAPISWVITDGGLAETAPIISTIVPEKGQLSVYITAPSCMSSQRTTYQYSTNNGSTWVTVSSLSSPIVITGLNGGQNYPVMVRATGGSIGIGTNGPQSVAKIGTPVIDGAEIKAKNETSIYGAAVPTVGYTTTIAPGDWVSSATCGAYTDSTYVTAVTSATKPGTYVTHCTGPAKTGLNSDAVYKDGVYTVTKAPLTITAKSFTKTYGDAITLDGTQDFTVSGLIGSDAVASVTLTSSGTGASARVALSPYSVVPSAAVGAASQVLTQWYTIRYANGSITVNKAPGLTVSGTTYILSEGAPDLATLAVSYSASGFVNSETFASPNTAPTCAVYDSNGILKPAPYSSLAVGVYAVRCSGGVAANYDGITYSDGSLTVKSLNVAVTAKSANSAYGSAVSAPSPGYDVVGDLNGVTVTCAAYTDTVAPFTNLVTSSTKPGTYVTHCSGDVDNGAPDNTPIEYTDGVYTVTKVPLTVTAESWSKTYGDVITPAGASDFTSSGLVNGDGIGSVTLTTSGAMGTAGVAGSPYSVVPSAAVGAASQVLTDYYDITYVDGAITVARKSLTVEADDVMLQVGAAIPTSYSASYTGWVNGENDDTQQPAGWVAPTCESSFNSTTPLGTPVDVTCSGGAAEDYEFVFVSGSVTVGNPEVTVENTTKPAYETSGSTANVALSATITDWAPGCKVTFTLNPSTGTASPYTVYTTASNDVSVNAVLPVGVY
ncbi:MAG: BspA family leucine-rich repeat surface protein, partial [Actinobacteria bacterium]|nr:BspA family leucine-rich repeat surface protein [Actinomycetota bacterium]